LKKLTTDFTEDTDYERFMKDVLLIQWVALYSTDIRGANFRILAKWSADFSPHRFAAAHPNAAVSFEIFAGKPLRY